MIPGIARYARARGDWQLTLGEKLTQESLADAADGVIGIFSVRDAGMAEELVARGSKLVGVSGFQPLPDVPLVSHDDVAIGRMAAEHLLSKGLREFAVVSMAQAANHRLRVEGFSEVLRQRNLPPPVVLVGDTKQIARELPGLPRPCGVFAVNDQRARHFEEAARRKGFRIPGDFAVLGVDNDTVHSELSPVPLSSITLQFEEIGWQAAALLDRLMHGEAPPEPVLLPPLDVEVRNSTEYLLVEDPLIRRAMAIMRQRMAETVGIADYAEQLGVSRRHLEYRFRAATGSSINRELRTMRMEAARRMLLSKPLRVQEIAEAVGCPDINRFSTYFREAYGVPPSAYRKANS